MRVLVATRSQDKLAEIRRILAGVPGLTVTDLSEAGVAYDPAEEGLEPHDTFEANALSKAHYFAARSGLPVVADDSGLEVDALGGAPGVRSKRFAPAPGLSGTALDEANNAHLLRLLDGVPPGDRTARYVCVAALVGLHEGPLICRGEAPGRILGAGRGQGGFGYDPLFYDPALDATFAELSREDKNARSHRGRAFRALSRRLEERG